MIQTLRSGDKLSDLYKGKANQLLHNVSVLYRSRCGQTDAEVGQVFQSRVTEGGKLLVLNGSIFWLGGEGGLPP